MAEDSANLYLILNNGCDDTTSGLARMTDEQFEFFKVIIENLNKNSTYGCMPTIDVYRINDDYIREFADDDNDDNDDYALYLDGKVYTLKDHTQTYTDDFRERKVIG